MHSDPDAGDILSSAETISLTEVLSNYRLTGKMRLVLAYTIAHSVWRYYNSDWMKSKWSANSIHVVEELDPVKRRSNVYACNPCLAIQFKVSHRDFTEYHDGTVAHKYPRVLSLGALLLDIGRQNVVEERGDTDFESFDQEINHDCARGINIMKHDTQWPYLDGLSNSIVRSTYKEITQACFDKRLFYTGSVSQDVEERRSILYNRIVAPLRDLVQELGWSDALTIIEPVEENNKADSTGHSSPLVGIVAPSKGAVSGRDPRFLLTSE